MMATAMTPHPAETPPVELHRITLDVYRKLGRLGLILPPDRVELLDGLLVKKVTAVSDPTARARGFPAELSGPPVLGLT
jgi:hypothetical protein